jgi:hypothetical protein
MTANPSAQPNLTNKADRFQLHVTSLNTMAHCGEKFRRRYIEGHIIPPGVAMVVGKSIDQSVTANMVEKIRTGAMLTRSDVEDIAVESFKAEWSQGIALSDDEMKLGEIAVRDEGMAKALRLSKLHLTDIAPGIEPSAVQVSFSLNLGAFLEANGVTGIPLDLVGSVDIMEEYTEQTNAGEVHHAAIRDTKSAKITPGKSVADESDQLSGYATHYLFNAKALDVAQSRIDVALDYLIDNKTPKALTLRSYRDTSDAISFLNRVTATAKALKAGVFVPAQSTDPMCSAKYCGYHSTCQYVKGRRTAVVPDLVQIT